MYEFTSVAAAPVAVGLIGSDDPPLSPEPIAPAPSNFEAPPIPLRSFESILAERTATAAATPTAAVETRRIVIQLLGGEQVELDGYDDRDTAVAAARELMARFSAAESTGEWPELDGRFIRPGAVASIDVLSATT
jgi:hypothetical protein